MSDRRAALVPLCPHANGCHPLRAVLLASIAASLMALGVVMWGCGAAVGPQGATISGVVADATNVTQGIGGANLYVYVPFGREIRQANPEPVTSTVSAADGSYSLTGVPAGDLQVVVTLPFGSGFAGVILDITVAGTAQISLKITLVPADVADQIAEIAVSPNPATVAPGGTEEFTSTIVGGDGAPITNISPTWTVIGNIGTIDSNGGFTASQQEGTGFVAASAAGRVGLAAVTVVSTPSGTPVITAHLSARPTSGAAPLDVAFTGAASTTRPDIPITQYVLSFGDGSPNLTSASPPSSESHTYSSVGTYTATLTATDQQNHTASGTASIEVTPVTTGLPIADNPQAASAAAKAALDQLWDSFPSSTQDLNQRVQTFEGLVQTNHNDGGAQFGLALIQLGEAIDRASTQVNFNPYAYIPVNPANPAQFSRVLERPNRLAEPLVRALNMTFVRGPVSMASIRQQQEPTAPEVQEAIRSTILPVVGGGGLPTDIVGAIERLHALVNFQGVLVSITWTDPESQTEKTRNVYGADVEAGEAELWALRSGLLGAISRDFDYGTFDFNRTPQQMDTNGDSLLTTDEYLPGGNFLTLLPAISGYPAGGQLGPVARTSLDTALVRGGEACSRIIQNNDPAEMVEAPDIPQDFQSNVSDLRALLAGPQTVTFTILDRQTGTTYPSQQIQVNLRAFFDSPVPDLRTLAPVIRITGPEQHETQMESFPDLTFGGIVPSGWPSGFVGSQYEVTRIEYGSIILD